MNRFFTALLHLFRPRPVEVEAVSAFEPMAAVAAAGAVASHGVGAAASSADQPDAGALARARLRSAVRQSWQHKRAAHAETSWLEVTPDALLEILVRTLRELLDVARTEADRDAVRKLFAATSAQDLDLPRLPDVAQRVMAMAPDEVLSFQQLASLVGRDQDLAARVLQISNSPIYGARRELVSLDSAAAHLGLERFRDIVVGAVAEAAVYRVPGFEAEVADERKHASDAAVLASLVAWGGRTALSRGEAYLGGLLHDVGRVLVLRNLSRVVRSRRELARISPEMLRDLMDRLHVPLGVYYAIVRGLPHPVRAAIAYHHRPLRADARFQDIAMATAIADAVCDSPLPAGSTIQARRVAEGLGLDASDEALIGRIANAAHSWSNS